MSSVNLPKIGKLCSSLPRKALTYDLRSRSLLGWVLLVKYSQGKGNITNWLVRFITDHTEAPIIQH